MPKGPPGSRAQKNPRKRAATGRKAACHDSFGMPDQTLTGDLPVRSLACPMPYGTDIIYGDSSFVIYFEVQGFCGAICTKCRVLPRFLRRPISKLLAGIALPTTSFHHTLSPCH